MSFGPEYPKIQTIYRRDERGVIVPGEWSTPELAYLAELDWTWTEKVDGTNIRLHWDGESASVGGRTDRAQVPAKLVAALGPVLKPYLWLAAFPGDAYDVTVYGEGYGAGIQSGGQYRQDQSLAVFDVRIGEWWLRDEDVRDVAAKLGLEVVPQVLMGTLVHAAFSARDGLISSDWPEARIEGLVGRPKVDLSDRRGERIMAKIKAKDWRDYERRG